MKLYVWDNVLTDYTDGIMFAVAESLEQAREALLEQDRRQFNCNGRNSSSVLRDLEREPKVYDLTEPVCRLVHGGG